MSDMTTALHLARSGEGLKSGPIALAVILVLCVVCYFLFKSMSKHLRKVREEFPVESGTTTPAAGPAAGPAAANPATNPVTGPVTGPAIEPARAALEADGTPTPTDPPGA